MCFTGVARLQQATAAVSPGPPHTVSCAPLVCAQAHLSVGFYHACLQEIASECGVRAMPTFQAYYNGSKVDELTGADPKKLEAMILA